MMTTLWQLRNLTTNENLGEPQELPLDWEGIFGLHGFVDKLGDLTWLGNPAIKDLGWFDTGILIPPLPITEVVESNEVKVKKTARIFLSESDWAMLPDVPMTKGDRIKWEEYRRSLREIKLQSGFPDDIKWPAKPE